MKKKNRKKIVILSVIIITIAILITTFIVLNKNPKQVPITTPKKEEEIANYDYYIDDNDTKLYKTTFQELKEILKQEAKDDEEYSKVIAKLFVIDFYDLNSKINNNDIGGIQFIYEESKNNFIMNAKDSIYKYVENNIYNDRKQELPIVTKVEPVSFNIITYKYQNNIFENAYEISLKVSYEADLNYPSEVKVTIIKENEKMSIVEVK